YTGRLSGIVNGIDYAEYDPATDPRIHAHFSAAKPAGKAACKKALQEESGLPVDPKAPLIGIISRLADQKGFDIIAEAADRMLKLPIQLVLLGSGDHRYETLFTDLQKRCPKQVRANLGFDADLAQRLYGGSEM